MGKFSKTLCSIVLLMFSVESFANPGDYRENFALVIIDMQAFFASRNKHDQDVGNKKKVEEVLKNQIEAIKMAKASKIPIIFIEYVGLGDTNEELVKAAEGGDVKHVLKATDGMLDYENDYTAEFSKYLESKKIGHLIIAGANGGACVQQSIIGSLYRNFDVTAFNKGIADFNYKEFIYPYVHPYKIIPGCDECKFRAVMDLETIALELTTKKANSDYVNMIINDSGREPKSSVLEKNKLNGLQKNSGAIAK